MTARSYVKAKGRERAGQESSAQQSTNWALTYIYYQFISVTGRIVGKGIPADHWEATAKRGFQLVYGATANLFLDRHRNYIGYGPEASELVGIPDPETFVQLPWDKRVGRVFCTLFRNREEEQDPGGYLTSDCRGNLRRSMKNSQKTTMACTCATATEPEMIWLKKGTDGSARRGLQQAVLLSHRSVRSTAAGGAEGHRVLPGDGS